MAKYHLFYRHYIKKQLWNEIIKRATCLIKGEKLEDNEDQKDSLNYQINCEAKKLALYELHHMESSFHE